MSPSQFAKETLKLNCWSKMEEIFQAVEAGERKILVRSCNGAGKTTALAAICNWYLCEYPDSIVLTTASSWMQVRRNLWGEIRRQARAAELYKDEQGNPLKLGETLIKISEKHFMIGISPRIPENAMGFHAPHILVAVDEATGINDEIMTALTGNLSGVDSQIIMICNPIDRESYPYRAEQSGEWKVIHISAFDHPNVKEGKEIIKGAVTREWIEDRVRSWSYEVSIPQSDKLVAESERAIELDWCNKFYRESPVVKARILGEWAQLDSIGFIPMELIKEHVWHLDDKASVMRSAHPVTVRSLGVDISRGLGRDATVYTWFDVRQEGPDVQTDFKVFLDDDLMTTADKIKSYYNESKAEGIELIIGIDDTGIGGGVTDRLRRMEIPHSAINFNQKPRGIFPGKHLANARAEMYFLLHHELLESKIVLRDFNRFHEELSAIRLDISAASGAYKMEDKTEVRTRLGRSPDYADATALARYALRLEALKNKVKFIP